MKVKTQIVYVPPFEEIHSKNCRYGWIQARKNDEQYWCRFFINKESDELETLSASILLFSDDLHLHQHHKQEIVEILWQECADRFIEMLNKIIL